MFKRIIGSIEYRAFDSVEEVISTCQPIADGKLVRINPFNRPEFLGRMFKTWGEVYAAARGEWAEGVETVNRMLDDLASAGVPQPVSRRRKPRFDEAAGDEVDYDRLRSGQPLWRTTSRRDSRAPQTVTVVIDVNSQKKVAHADILWRGAAAIALTEKLEAADFRVELWVVHKATDCCTGGVGHCNAICLKRAGDPLDKATFVSAVSGWFYRSLLWRAKGLLPGRLKKALGAPVAPTTSDLQVFLPGQTPVLISGAYSYAAAVELVRSTLKRLTTPAEPKPEPPPTPVREVAAAKPEPPVPLTPQELAAARKRLRAWLAQRVET